jgi:hypothetical protein
MSVWIGLCRFGLGMSVWIGYVGLDRVCWFG